MKLGHLADEIEEIEDGNEDDGHPAAEPTADDLRLDARKQRQRHEVDDTDRRHVRPDALRHFQPSHQTVCKPSQFISHNHFRCS